MRISAFFFLSLFRGKFVLKAQRVLPTFQPMFSKKVHSLVCPVVLPPHGPAIENMWLDKPKFSALKFFEKISRDRGSFCVKLSTMLSSSPPLFFVM